MNFRPLLRTIMIVLVFHLKAYSQVSYDRSHLIDLFQNDDYEAAKAYLRSDSSDKESFQYQSDLGYALFMSGDLSGARTAFRVALEHQPSSVRAHLYLGRASEELDLPDSALFHYLKLTSLVPRNYRYWQKAVQLLTEMGDNEAALSCATKGFELNQNSGALTVQLANALIRAKKPLTADSVVSAFLSRDSSDRDVIAKKTELAFRVSDYRQVVLWGEKLLADSADLTTPYINLAYSYLNLDSFSKSILICEWLIGKNKAYPQVLYCAALAHAKRKEFVLSNDYLDKCISLSIQKEAIMYMNAKSDNYEEMKQFRLAANYHDTSYYIFHSPRDLYYAGRIYDKYLGNPVKAGSYYRQFIAKRKRPVDKEEMVVFKYIEEFLEAQKGKAR